MLELVIKKKKINTPTHWEELNADMYIKLVDLINLYRDKETGELKIDDELMYQKMIQIVLNMSRDRILKLDYRLITTLKTTLKFLQTPIPQPESSNKVKFGNHVIKLSDFSDITWGQFADIQNMMKQEKIDELKIIAKIAEVYIPRNIFKLRFKDVKLELTDDEKITIIKKIPCTDFISLSFFLFKKMIKYMRNTKRSLHLLALRTNAGTTLRAIGVIIRYSWLWLTIKLTWSKK